MTQQRPLNVMTAWRLRDLLRTGKVSAERLLSDVYDEINRRGGVAEWLKAPVLKTGRRKPRGFESHPHRHFSNDEW